MAALDQVRRDEIREKGKEHKDLMKDSRYIWLKNPWNLTPKQRARLSSLEHMNLKINRAYLLNSPLKKLVFPDRFAKRAIVPLPVSCAIPK